MAIFFFAVVLLAVIVYAVSTAAKKARARAAKAFVQAAQSGAFGVQPGTSGAADTTPGTVRTVVRNGSTTVTVRTSATMADGSPLTPFAQQTLNNLTAHNGGSLLGAEQMAALRQAMQSNGMGQLSDIIEHQLQEEGVKRATASPGDLPAQDSASSFQQFAAAQDLSAQPRATPPVVQRSPDAPTPPANAPDPFAPAQNPFHAGDVFSNPSRDEKPGEVDPFRTDKPLF